QRRQARDQRRATDLGMTRQCTDAQPAVMLGNGVEPDYAVDVDKKSRLEQAHVEGRHEALATGENLRLVPLCGEDGKDLIERARPHIAQPRRFQCLLLVRDGSLASLPGTPNARPRGGRERWTPHVAPLTMVRK